MDNDVLGFVRGRLFFRHKRLEIKQKNHKNMPQAIKLSRERKNKKGESCELIEALQGLYPQAAR